MHYIEKGVFPDEMPVCGVQYVGLLHPILLLQIHFPQSFHLNFSGIKLSGLKWSWEIEEFFASVLGILGALSLVRTMQ
jgi:hypothetical protein